MSGKKSNIIKNYSIELFHLHPLSLKRMYGPKEMGLKIDKF